jgi:nucleotide-binding universal stress UspA family protein
MIKKILVPIAFSKYSLGILQYAADLAAATGAEMIVANVINERDLAAVDKITSHGYKVDIGHYVETIKNERREELQRLMDRLTLPDDRVSYLFCIGDPTNELIELVIDKGIDMVVMGVRNRDFSYLFTGSVAERMFSRCPVTIVSYRDKEISDQLRKKFNKHRHKED